MPDMDFGLASDSDFHTAPDLDKNFDLHCSHKTDKHRYLTTLHTLGNNQIAFFRSLSSLFRYDHYLLYQFKIHFLAKNKAAFTLFSLIFKRFPAKRHST